MVVNPIDWGGFRCEIADIEIIDNPQTVRLKSRDYFWYSPILNEQLKKSWADLVVMPNSEAQVIQVAAACAKFKVPMTVRGGGTGNYGQAVPLVGGIILDMTRLDQVCEVGDGFVRTQAGIMISDLDARVHKTGQELLMWPSTRTQATIGGFISGGSAGIGSVRHGVLRDDGNVRALRIVTLEEMPRIITLEGPDIQKAHHAYGTNGIITELELAVRPAVDWHHGIVLFDTYAKTIEFGHSLCRDEYDVYLISTVENRFSAFYPALSAPFPSHKHAVFTMIGQNTIDIFKARASEVGGEISLLMSDRELHQAKLPPSYECAWNHTTLQALKSDRSWTYLQIAYPQPYDPKIDKVFMAEFGDEVLMHHEFAKERGEYQLFSLPLLKFTTKERLYQITTRFEQLGCTVFDAHVFTIAEGGMKVVDELQVAFKAEADPYNLMNPGKTSQQEADQVFVEYAGRVALH